MKIAVITGSGGLVGSECCLYFSAYFDHVLGIDNDQRKFFFGEKASVEDTIEFLRKNLSNFLSFGTDIRNNSKLEEIFLKYGRDIRLVIHAAAQPSHDWSATAPYTDFEINALGTLNILELVRKFSPEAIVIFISTNKVYGDHVNNLPLVETRTRWELADTHPYFKNGIDEKFMIDNCLHSPFGVSKTAADLLVQEYGKYFGLNTVVFRAGCITGPRHKGARLHGFLAYLTKCLMKGNKYTVYGYRGKQVRDVIHVKDLVNAFGMVVVEKYTLKGEVYNIGGGRESNCSILEAIGLLESLTGKKFEFEIEKENRKGDHKWWISDTSKFQDRYSGWRIQYRIEDIIRELADTE
ncbi:MAG TPA: NAD-dependent epimerase/dehydratase family protein [Cyclobacteriaceae bacterium]|nr:NAD-dependent epimerase/dehydratase family protein [Cyclobacteriaceae bacterium]